MRQSVGRAAPRFYVASFSEDGDALSQWRAYCPRLGGYAMAFPPSIFKVSPLSRECCWSNVRMTILRSATSFARLLSRSLNDLEAAPKDQRVSRDFRAKLVHQFVQSIAHVGRSLSIKPTVPNGSGG